MYLMLGTHLDIAFTVIKNVAISPLNSQPKDHLEKSHGNIMRYLIGNTRF